MEKFDILVIGAGPGGCNAALKAAKHGFKTALIEKENLGGTCLNTGCIPSKALLHATEIFHAAKHGASVGIIGGDALEFDIPAMLAHKNSTMERLRNGMGFLVEKQKITRVNGTALLKKNGTVLVKKNDGTDVEFRAERIILATGSVPVELPFLKFDGEKIVSSTDALNFGKPPAKLVIIGAGAIGLELGSIWSRLGSEVTIVEMLPAIGGPGFDQDTAKVAERALKKQGINFELQTKVTGAQFDDAGVILLAEKNGAPVSFPADKILVAVGRKPNVFGICEADAGLEIDARGRIIVDENFQTNLPGIFAIGDIVAGPMLAHKAEMDGVICIEKIAGKFSAKNTGVIPGVVYTDPEMATAGLTETAAKTENIGVKIKKFPLLANGRAVAANATDGVVKLVIDAENDTVLGAQIIAKNASEMIAAILLHIEKNGTAAELAGACFPHPTVSEAIKNAAEI